MFQVNLSQNRLERLKALRFADLKLREREHLQEWLVHQPDALGEELLIIQKEFDGFADTRERLDLLALDKEGKLVVIENKLDDSGRDVAWQALKYTAYVSSLTKAQIIDIHQSYLDRYCGGGSAVHSLCEFLEIDELDEIVLNEGNDQRLIFVAANFRKEVTATVLWLREHQIDSRCYKIIPYQYGEDLFVDIQAVIPTPEAADFMIGMAEKESEARNAKGAQRRSHKLRLEFWDLALTKMRERGLSRYEAVSPSKDNWIVCGSGIGGVQYGAVFTQSEARVELLFQSPIRERNKAFFDHVAVNRENVEAKFGEPLSWLRMDEAKSSKVALIRSFDGYNKEQWPEMASWIGDSMVRIQQVFDPILSDSAMKVRG